MEASNTKEMREALEDSNGLLAELTKMDEWGDAANCQIADNKAALSSPPRNCDVGSPAEQAERFKRFCDEHTDSGKSPSCGMCPILPAINRGGTKELCSFYWAQRPYEVTQEGHGK